VNQAELLEELAGILEELRIPYFVTGSVATIAYGEPRFTNDIDIVVQLFPIQIDPLCQAFSSDDFYISIEAVVDAVTRRGQFNILHPSSGLKIDVMVADDSDFNQSRFTRTRQLQISPHRKAEFASPEDVIIKKLAFYREGGSDKHIRDIRGVLAVLGENIERSYIESWVTKLGLSREWSIVLDST